MRCVVSSVIIRSHLHVKLFDIKVRKRALLTLILLPNLRVIYRRFLDGGAVFGELWQLCSMVQVNFLT